MTETISVVYFETRCINNNIIYYIYLFIFTYLFIYLFIYIYNLEKAI